MSILTHKQIFYNIYTDNYMSSFTYIQQYHFNKAYERKQQAKVKQKIINNYFSEYAE